MTSSRHVPLRTTPIDVSAPTAHPTGCVQDTTLLTIHTSNGLQLGPRGLHGPGPFTTSNHDQQPHTFRRGPLVAEVPLTLACKQLQPAKPSHAALWVAGEASRRKETDAMSFIDGDPYDDLG